jgi:hypothetical protein
MLDRRRRPSLVLVPIAPVVVISVGFHACRAQLSAEHRDQRTHRDPLLSSLVHRVPPQDR